MTGTLDHIRNITIVGGAGNVGKQIVASLLALAKFNITAISRSESNSSFSPDVIVKKGDYASPAFLQSALHGQEVLILALSGQVPPTLQSDLIAAAAEANVPWILPNEYSGDGANEAFSKAVPIVGKKSEFRHQIERTGTSSWIGICTNQWVDWALWANGLGINITDRHALLHSGGVVKTNLTTLPQVGRAVAALLSLPVKTSDGSPCLEDYRNKFLYVRSLCVNQKELLDSAQRLTKTTDEDWTIVHDETEDYVKEGWDKVSKGDFLGWMNILRGAHITPGVGDIYHGQELGNERIGLPEEDLDQVMQTVLRHLETDGPRLIK